MSEHQGRSIRIHHLLPTVRGLITVPASSNTRDKLRRSKPTSSYLLANACPVKTIDKYCSPSKKFTPIAVEAVEMIKRVLVLRS